MATVGFLLLTIGVANLVYPAPMLRLLDRLYFSNLSPLAEIRRRPENLARAESERGLIRFLLPLAAIAIGAVWLGYALFAGG